MSKWMVAAKKADFNKIAEKYGITPVLARIIRNRDITGDDEIRKYLEGNLSDLYDPFLLKDMERAAGLLLSKIEAGLPMRVIGDYDVDGICSTYILVSGLRFLGAEADRVIPHRIRDGYGLNDTLIEEAGADGIDTIITCDNGIAASPQIALGKEMGMTIIVTDHHEVPFEGEGKEKRYLLPPADAVIDPKQPGCGYPFKQICGAVVAYKLIGAMLERAGKGFQERRKLLEELLPFAALATVCDVMELRDENRILVKYGLRAMKGPEMWD